MDMRPALVLLLIAHAAHADPGAAYGLAPGPVKDGDIWVLDGCRRFSDAERVDAQALAETWAKAHSVKGWSPQHVFLSTGCWIGDEGVIRISYWSRPPDEMKPGSYTEILTLRRGKLALVERYTNSEETTGENVDLTSAGDLDGDGHLDFVYTRPFAIDGRFARREVVAVVGGKPMSIGPSMHGGQGTNDCPKGVLFHAGDARGVAILPHDSEYCAPPVGMDTAEAWRITRGKLVRDAAIDARLRPPAAKRP